MKKLTFSELFAIGLGFTLGSAVFSLTGVAAMYTGGSTFLAYIVGAVAIFFMMLPVIISASIVPRQGVSYSLSKEALTHSMGGFYFWIFFIGRIAMFANITALAIFITSVFTTWNPKIVAGAACVLFYVTNYFGMKTAAKAGKIMNVILLLGYAVFIVFGIINMDTTFVFNKEYFLTHGASGFLNAISLLVFCMGGGMSMLEMGGIVEQPERNLPKACFLITLCAGLLYAGIALATMGALPYVDPSEGGSTMAGTLLFFPSSDIGTWNTNIMKASTNLQILVNIIPNFALLAVPKLYPEAWAKSRWHMSKGLLHVTMWVPTLFSIYLWWLNFRGLTIEIQYVLLALFAAGAVFAFVGGKTFAKPKTDRISKHS